MGHAGTAAPSLTGSGQSTVVSPGQQARLEWSSPLERPSRDPGFQSPAGFPGCHVPLLITQVDSSWGPRHLLPPSRAPSSITALQMQQPTSLRCLPAPIDADTQAGKFPQNPPLPHLASTSADRESEAQSAASPLGTQSPSLITEDLGASISACRVSLLDPSSVWLPPSQTRLAEVTALACLP
jgi:hypothetical protein